MKKVSWLASILVAGSASLAAGSEPVVWLLGKGGTVELKNWPAACTTYAGPGSLVLPTGQIVHLQRKAVVVCSKGQVEPVYELADLDGDGFVDVRPLAKDLASK